MHHSAPGIIATNTHLQMVDVHPYHVLLVYTATMTVLDGRRNIEEIILWEVPGTYAQWLSTFHPDTGSCLRCEGEPAYITLIGGFLCSYVWMILLPYAGRILTDEVTALTVGIVLLRTSTQPGHLVVVALQNHAHTETRHLRQRLVARHEVHVYLYISVGKHLIGNLHL